MTQKGEEWEVQEGISNCVHVQKQYKTTHYCVQSM